MSLRDDFGDDFASSAFGEVAGDRAIIGKWGNIVEMEDGSVDCWFIRRDGQPLTERKISAIQKKCRDRGGLTRLDGEAYTRRGRGREFVLFCAALAGVKRKRRMSDEAKRAGAERLRRAREVT